jgi:hypothetical protein
MQGRRIRDRRPRHIQVHYAGCRSGPEPGGHHPSRRRSRAAAGQQLLHTSLEGQVAGRLSRPGRLLATCSRRLTVQTTAPDDPAEPHSSCAPCPQHVHPLGAMQILRGSKIVIMMEICTAVPSTDTKDASEEPWAVAPRVAHSRCCTLLLHQDQKRPVPRSELASELGAPLRNRTVDLLLTIHAPLGSLPGKHLPEDSTSACRTLAGQRRLRSPDHCAAAPGTG